MSQDNAKKDKLTQPLDVMELDWESNDKSRSGKTTLGSRIKKLEKVINVEEESIAREMEHLRELNLELEYAAMEVVGVDVNNQVLSGNLDWYHWDPQQDTVNETLSAEIELEIEKSRWADVFEATNTAAINEMKESEKVSSSPS